MAMGVSSPLSTRQGIEPNEKLLKSTAHEARVTLPSVSVLKPFSA